MTTAPALPRWIYLPAIAGVLCVALGVPMAMVLARSGARVVRPLILLPLVPTVALAADGRGGRIPLRPRNIGWPRWMRASSRGVETGAAEPVRGAVSHGGPAVDVVPGEPAVAIFTPAAVAVYRDQPHGSPRNTVEVTAAELRLAPGDRVYLSVKAQEVTLHPGP